MNDINVELLEEILNFQIDISGATKLIELVDAPHSYEDGKYLKSTSNGFVLDTPAGGGDMLKALYDANNNGIVDLAEEALKIDGGVF